MKVFFYPHAYLRDRHLDTIRRWPADQVVNPYVVDGRLGKQVDESSANASQLKASWKQKLPLLNVKLRPAEAPPDSVVYVWGGIIATGRFIVDLDNPWALVGYNLRAMPVYRLLIKRLLLSARCIEIRCMSEACRSGLLALFGEAVYNKAQVYYPCIPQVVKEVPVLSSSECRFLFVGTQFELKGGIPLVKAFRRLYGDIKSVRLDVVTHLPNEYRHLVEGCPGLHLHSASFSRDEIHEKFMRHADILILPTFVESFGMVALEALAHGLGLIATDVYALREMVEDGKNGRLISPPISVWNGVLPSVYYYDWVNIKKYIRDTDTNAFEEELLGVMKLFASDAEKRLLVRQGSAKLMAERFTC